MTNPKLIEGQQLESLEANDGTLKIWTNGTDPYVWLHLDKEELYPVLEKDYTQKLWIKNILMLLLIDGGAVVAFVFRKKVLTLPIELLQNRKLIMNLAKNDFKTKYAGSYLGIVWAFVQPIVTILVYWFVFSVGLKAGNVSDYPFVLYLVSGIVPWFFFQDALNGGTNALMEYNYLVKKVVFKISVLPIVKMISALFVHAFFVVFSLVLCSLYGYTPSLATLQIFYYSLCTFMFTLGLVYATSAIVVFFRDLTQIISIFLQVGIWLTHKEKRMKRIAKFHKVSWEQFRKDWVDTFGEQPEEKIREIYEGIKLPKRATRGSAGYDFFTPVSFTLAPGEMVKIPTGVRVEMAEDWVLCLYPRSGLGFKYRLQLNNTVGIIDSDYFYSDNEGHMFMKLTNDSKEGKTLEVGQSEGMVQGIFMQYGITEDDDADGVRNGGFGSTTGK